MKIIGRAGENFIVEATNEELMTLARNGEGSHHFEVGTEVDVTRWLKMAEWFQMKGLTVKSDLERMQFEIERILASVK